MEEPQENAARLDTVQYREMTRKLRNSPVSFVSHKRAESYLTLPRSTSGEPMT
jgi:hypothetical protein